MSNQAFVRREAFYIGGEWTVPISRERLTLSSPVTGAPIGSVPMATTTEADHAVEKGRHALPGWAAAPIEERAELLRRVGAGLDQRRGELEDLIAAEIGAPRSFISGIHVGVPIDRFLSATSIAAEIPVLTLSGRSRVRLEPVGVVAAITPWNYPLLQVAEKVLPALLAGCTVVLKPSEMTPLTAYVLAEVMHGVGVPAGVFNLVCGDGAGIGEHLVSSRGVDMISFTGSTRAGRRISALAADRVKPTMMELGGKSPAVILSDTGDADFDDAVSFTVRNCYENAGQTCTALTRLIVPAERRIRAENVAVDVARSLSVGGPDDDADLGPLISDTQLQRVKGFVVEAVTDGARLLLGGDRVQGRPGNFFEATVLSGVTESMRIAQEEVFGPVLVIQEATDDADALRLANDTEYGLAAAIWGTDPDMVTAAAFQLQAGWVTVNGADPDGDLPFGGIKQSGHGREAGVAGVMEYLTTKVLTA